MRKDLSVEQEIEIAAAPEKVWKVVTEPLYVKQYMFGADLHTDWEVGSDIVFQGEWQGQSYRDGGKVTANETHRLLQYTYWSAWSGLEDKPENYSLVTFHLEDKNGGTLLKVKQEGFANEEAQQHSVQGWSGVFSKIKELAEAA